MKKIVSLFCAIVLIVSSFSVCASAVTIDAVNADKEAAYAYLFDGVAGDVNGDDAVNALDARAVLLASAGLKGECKMTKADIDCDGKVTAIDARTLLRVSAQLENADVITKAYQVKLFNAMLNDLKADMTNNPQRVRYSNYSKNIEISCTNDNLLNKLSEQMNKIGEMAGEDESFDILAEMKKDSGKELWSKAERMIRQNNQFTVTSKDYVSNLSANDVASVEYKTNQSYNYQHTSINRNGEVENSATFNKNMTGLDSITVTFANEKITSVPSDMTTLKHGKIFGLPASKTFTENYGSLNNMFDGLDIGKFAINFKNINFHDSQVTIYFDHETKKICAADYKLYYDFVQTMDIDLQAILLGLDVEGKADLVDKEYSWYSCCFPANYIERI